MLEKSSIWTFKHLKHSDENLEEEEGKEEKEVEDLGGRQRSLKMMFGANI